MERAAGERAADAEPPQAQRQLGGGFPGEREREDMLGLDSVLAYPERDPAGEHTRFPRPGRGDDREQRMRRDDGGPLLRVEVVEEAIAHAATVVNACAISREARKGPE